MEMNAIFTSIPSKPDLGMTKILAVDDEKTILRFLEILLKKSGYQVITCSDSLKSIEIIEKERPDIILLDVMMPEMDGFEICRRLKSMPSTKNIPIIFITIKGEDQDKIAGFQSGGVDYITKPFEAEVLLARLQKHRNMYWLRCTLEHAVVTQTENLHKIKQALDEANHFLVKGDMSGVVSSLEEGSLIVNAQGVCLQANNTALRLLGYHYTEQLEGENLNLYPLNHDLGTIDVLGNPISIHKEIFSSDALWYDKDHRGFPVEFRSRPMMDKSGKSHILINFSDISQRKLIESRLYALAYKDSMTGLSNRALFMMLLKKELIQLQSSNQLFAILLLDIDYFKQINDGYGHITGDELLIMLAQRLLASSIAKEKIARLGGDEFSLIINGFKDKTELLQLVANLSESLNAAYQFNSGLQLNITVSIGVSICDDKHLSTEDILGRTDLALYKAKENRAGNYYLYDEYLAKIHGLELEIKHKLPALLANNSFFVEYQPQFSTQTQEYIGAEALIRWNHPVSGKLKADDFLESAKKIGFIKDISYFVLNKVCEQIHQWMIQDLDFKSISVNVCAEQIIQKDFLHKITTPLIRYNIPFHKITLEITENSLINVSPGSFKALEELHQLGIQFAIDDFGVGFSSMKLLKSFQFDVLKIDKLFVAEIFSSEKNNQILKSLISLAYNLNIKIVAEGVETKEQLLFLQEHECDFVQGFYFSPSLSANKLAQYFTRTR
ncbi:EAL domain-containing response regulator [Thiofilum flexile]|uniref:EAL domain-containing response regulator n=1 Tax=Thiofilum flexile TaxID=125627 RepID=UPI00036BBDD0|nr:EAL domain-containing response regulator [Thiofilum flexile]